MADFSRDRVLTRPDIDDKGAGCMLIAGDRPYFTAISRPEIGQRNPPKPQHFLVSGLGVGPAKSIVLVGAYGPLSAPFH
jgi:hypothetical protein